MEYFVTPNFCAIMAQCVDRDHRLSHWTANENLIALVSGILGQFKSFLVFWSFRRFGSTLVTIYVSRYFGSLHMFQGYFGHFNGFGYFWLFDRFQEYFGHFGSFKIFLVILEVSRLFWSLWKFSRSILVISEISYILG